MAPEGTFFVQDAAKDAHGIVFNIQKYSIQDGPGIRTTVFLKGCPLRCAWCANPESQHVEPQIAHRDSLCSKCGRCVDACQEKAISVDAKGIYIDRKICTNCGKCIDVCSPQALKMFGDKMSVREVFEKVREDAEFYRIPGEGLLFPAVSLWHSRVLWRHCSGFAGIMELKPASRLPGARAARL